MHPLPPTDYDHIDLTKPAEVLWWCREFGVSERQLREAVASVGTSARSVRNWLRTTRR